MKRALLLALLLLLPVAVTGASVQQDQQQLDRTNADIRAAEARVAELRTRAGSMEKVITQLRAEVAQVEEQLAQTTRQLQALTAEKDKAQREFDEGTRKVTARQGVLARRVRAIYKRGGTAAYWQTLFAAKDFGDLLRRFRFLRLIMAHDAELIRDLRAERLRLDGEKRKLEARVAEIAAVKTQQDGDKRVVERKKKELEIALAQVNRQRGEEERKIANLRAAARQLQAAIDAAIRAARGQGSGPVAAVRGGSYPWPLRASGRAQVIRAFGAYRHPEYHVMVSNNGIDIAAPAGAEVLAIGAGKVAAAQEMTGNGRVVIVEHDGNLFSVYAYLSRISVAVGARVAAGQVLGTVGVRPDDGRSALHLETHAGNDAKNPLTWLRNQ